MTRKPIGDLTVFPQPGLFCFLLFLPFAMPEGLLSLLPSTYSQALWFSRILALCIIVIGLIRKAKVDLLFTLLSIYEILFLLSTYMNGGPLFDAFKVSILESGLVFSVIFAFASEVFVSFARKVRVFCLIVIFANYCTVLLFPDGLYTTLETNNWLLAFDNIQVLFFIASIAVSLVCDYDKYGLNRLSIWTYAILGLALASAVTYWSATSIIVLAVLALLIALRKKLVSVYKRFDARAILLANIIVTLLFVKARLYTYLLPLFSDLLNKDSTFLARTHLWEFAVDSIRDSLFIGHGYVDQIHGFMLFYASHPHNQFLYELYTVGIIGFVVFLGMIFYICNALALNRPGFTGGSIP